MPGPRNPRPLVLDTNALDDASFVHFLRGYRPPKILPSVAAMELARVYHNRSWHPNRLRRLLAEHGIEVEAFGEDHAIAAAFRALPDDAWSAKVRDHMIAAHVHGGRVLVTRNVRDFAHLDRANVATPERVMDR